MLRTIAFTQRIDRVVHRKRCLDPLWECLNPAGRHTLWRGKLNSRVTKAGAVMSAVDLLIF